MSQRIAIGYEGSADAVAASSSTLRAAQMLESDLLEDSKPRHECGVFGVFSQAKNASRVAFFALYALNHREWRQLASLSGCWAARAAPRDGSGRLCTNLCN